MSLEAAAKAIGVWTLDSGAILCIFKRGNPSAAPSKQKFLACEELMDYFDLEVSYILRYLLAVKRKLSICDVFGVFARPSITRGDTPEKKSVGI